MGTDEASSGRVNTRDGMLVMEEQGRCGSIGTKADVDHVFLRSDCDNVEHVRPARIVLLEAQLVAKDIDVASEPRMRESVHTHHPLYPVRLGVLPPR